MSIKCETPTGATNTGKGLQNHSHIHLTDNSAASQRARLLAWLLAVGPLSTLQARRELDVMHPAARVQELREAGHNIVTHWHYEETQRGRTHRVGRYVLLAGDQGGQVNG